MTRFEDLSLEQQELIRKHLDLVIEANKTTNLTRIDSVDDGMLLHVEDSLVGLEELQSSPEGLYADLGTGAGYPGIPLAIASGRETVLVDARQKKMVILDSIIKELGLEENVSTYAGRAELLARSRAGEFSVITARALSKLAVLMELASPLLEYGGHLVCYKAQLQDEEIDHALKVQKLTGMKLVSDRKLLLSDGETHRRIVTFEKASKPKVKLPRQEGMAQKNPLY